MQYPNNINSMKYKYSKVWNSKILIKKYWLQNNNLNKKVYKSKNLLVFDGGD